MNTAFPDRREVIRVDSPAIGQGMTADHRARPLVPPGDWAFTDPFLLLMEDWFPEGVFEPHPHRGIETVTYVIEGDVDHYDNHGNSGAIGPGGALWLTAGRGLVHNERPAGDKPVHLLQLWVNLPRESKLVPARYQEIHPEQTPVRRSDGAEIRVFSGSSGDTVSATQNYAKVTLVEVRAEQGAVVEQELPAGLNAFVVVQEGSAIVGSANTRLAAGQVGWLNRSDEASTVSLEAGDEGVRAFLIGGMPLHEPVAARGPFVMNTQEELAAGFAEFRAKGERFGL
jgi:quercetin 2,3-dioxygenase